MEIRDSQCDPPILSSPLTAFSPNSAFSSVDLPAPLGPTKPSTSPRNTVPVKSCTSVRPPTAMLAFTADTTRSPPRSATSKISDDQLFYCRARGISQEDAVSMIVDGFCKQVFRELPMEFAVEAKKLLEVSLEGAIG